ncbi:MAG TPA: hypothetical protein VF189_05400 [Patescibacteria group bacterium]
MRKEERILRFVGTFNKYGPYRRFIKRLDKATEKEGIPGAAREIFSKFKLKTTAYWDGDQRHTQEILKDTSKPVILVSNHPHMIEPLFFVAALPPRKNLSVVALSGVEYFFGKEIKSCLIPVYHKFIFEGKRHRQIRRDRNTKQIFEAEKRLADGGAIMIMPDGGDKTGNWRNGSLQLLEKALNLPEAYLVMAKVDNAKKGDLISLLFRRFVKRSPFEKTVSISRAIPVRDIPIPNELKNKETKTNADYKNVAIAMENFYNMWQNSEK